MADVPPNAPAQEIANLDVLANATSIVSPSPPRKIIKKKKHKKKTARKSKKIVTARILFKIVQRFTLYLVVDPQQQQEDTTTRNSSTKRSAWYDGDAPGGWATSSGAEDRRRAGRTQAWRDSAMPANAVQRIT